MSYAGLWSARWALMRPGNAAMSGIGVLIGVLVARPVWGSEPFAWTTALAAVLAGFLITAFGNVVNDIFDVEVDRRAHPERPLPSGAMTVRQAAGFAALLAVVGWWEAFVAAGLPLLLFASINTLLLALYARYWKGVAVLGNVIVALLVASTFLFGAFAMDGAFRPEWGHLWALAAMAGLVTWARELAKDLEDAPHDVDRRTLAQTHPGAARGVAMVTTLAAVALAAATFLPDPPRLLAMPASWSGSGVPFLPDRVMLLWRVGIAAASLVFLWALRSLREAGVAQRRLKLGMLIALLGYGLTAAIAFTAD
jgi:geranylgeranylglycerol-phosphate geranylgeranyltransferase